MPKDTLFDITLIVPRSNPKRIRWAQEVDENLRAVGIKATRAILGWDGVYSRVLTPPPATVGKTHDEGGFDALFIGYSMEVKPDPYAIYDSSQFVPDGANFYLWSNTENDRLCRLINDTVDETTRLQYEREWQQLGSTEQPSATIFYGFDGLSVQELGFNMQHPIFGTGVATPIGRQDVTRSAEAARYVRQAISHVIPRQEIIDTILDGAGTPGVTTPFPPSTEGFDPSLAPYSYNIDLAKTLLTAAGY